MISNRYLWWEFIRDNGERTTGQICAEFSACSMTVSRGMMDLVEKGSASARMVIINGHRRYMWSAIPDKPPQKTGSGVWDRRKADRPAPQHGIMQWAYGAIA